MATDLVIWLLRRFALADSVVHGSVWDDEEVPIHPEGGGLYNAHAAQFRICEVYRAPLVRLIH